MPLNFNDLINKLGTAKEAIDKLTPSAADFEESLKETIERTKDQAEAQEKLNKANKEGKETLTSLNKTLEDTKKAEDAASASARNMSNSWKEASKSANETKGFVDKLFGAVGKGLSNAHAGMRSGSLSTLLGGNELIAFLQEGYDRMQGLNKQLLAYSGATKDLALNSRGGAASNQELRGSMIDLGRTMGISTDAVVGYANSMMKMGFSQKDVNSEITIAGNKFKSMSAIQAASIKSGMDMSEGIDMVASSMQDLGDSMPTAVSNLVMIGTAAKNAGTSARFLSPIIKGLQSDFRFFGLDAQKATEYIAKAAKGSSNAKVDMEVMGQAIRGLKGASPGTQAFFGMGAGGVGGGRGAIGSSLQFEAAMAGKGAGYGSAFKGVTSQLNRVGGGGGVYTFDQALKGGAAETGFFKQRELVKSTMGMSQDQATKFLEVMARVEKQGGVQLAQDKKDLDDLKKTEVDWAAQTYDIETQMKSRMDDLYNSSLAQAGGSTLAALVGKMDAVDLTIVATGSSIVKAIWESAVAGGISGGVTNFLTNKLFKNAGKGVLKEGAGEVAETVGKDGFFKNLFKKFRGGGGAAATEVAGETRTITNAAKMGTQWEWATNAATTATKSEGILSKLTGAVSKVAGATSKIPGVSTALKVIAPVAGAYEIGKTGYDISKAKTGRGVANALEGSDENTSWWRRILNSTVKGAAIGGVTRNPVAMGYGAAAGLGASAGDVTYQGLKSKGLVPGVDSEKEEREAKKKSIQEEIASAQEKIKKEKEGTDSFQKLKEQIDSLNLSLSLMNRDPTLTSLKNPFIDAMTQKSNEQKSYGPRKMATGGIVLSDTLAQIAEEGRPEAVIPLDRLPGILQQTPQAQAQAQFIKQLISGTNSQGAGAAFAGRRGEAVNQEIRIKLEGEGILAGVRKEIVLCVEDGVVKGTRKTESAIVR